MASIASELYGGEDQAMRVLLGDQARQGTGWLYVQDAGSGMVSFVGSAREKVYTPRQRHELAYGSDRTHQFVLGQVIIRPSLVIGTDALRGTGLAGLATGAHNLKGMLGDQGEIIFATNAVMRKLTEAGEI
jgi:hypothetical protein